MNFDACMRLQYTKHFEFYSHLLTISLSTTHLISENVICTQCIRTSIYRYTIFKKKIGEMKWKLLLSACNAFAIQWKVLQNWKGMKFACTEIENHFASSQQHTRQNWWARHERKRRKFPSYNTQTYSNALIRLQNKI